MINPTKLKMVSDVPVASFKVRCVMGPAEAVIKETIVTGPFAANEEVIKDIFADGLAPVPPPFGPELRFHVWGTTAVADSARAASDPFTFVVPAAPVLTLL